MTSTREVQAHSASQRSPSEDGTSRALGAATVVPSPRGLRLLIAHDVPLFREALRVALSERHGFEVLPSTVGVDGVVVAARKARPRVILLDLSARPPGGLSALRALRADVPETAVLVMTEESDAASLVAAMALGASGHVSMSAAVAEVAQAISESASGKVLGGRHLQARVRHLALHGQPQPLCAEHLTDREREVLSRLAQGMSTRAIASDLGCAHNTARTHIQNVLIKLGVHSRVAAATLAVRDELV